MTWNELYKELRQAKSAKIHLKIGNLVKTFKIVEIGDSEINQRVTIKYLDDYEAETSMDIIMMAEIIKATKGNYLIKTAIYESKQKIEFLIITTS